MVPFLSALIQISSLFLIGHYLNSHELGVAGVMNSIINLVLFVSDGGTSGFYLFRKKLSKFDVLKINIITSVVAFCFIVLLFYCFFYEYINLFDVFFFFLFSFFSSVSLFYYSSLVANGFFNKLAVCEMLSRCVFIIVLFILVSLFETADSLLLAWVFSYAIRYVALRYLSKVDYISSNTVGILRIWWKYVRFQFVAQAFNYFVLMFDVVVISHFYGASAVGVYSLIKDSSLKISAALNPVINRVFSFKLISNEVDNFQDSKLYNNYIKLVGCFSVSVFVLWGVINPYIFMFVRSVDVRDFFYISMSWSYICACRMLITPLIVKIQISGKTKAEMLINALSFMLVVVFLLFLWFFLKDDIYTLVIIVLICSYSLSYVIGNYFVGQRFVGLSMSESMYSIKVLIWVTIPFALIAVFHSVAAF